MVPRPDDPSRVVCAECATDMNDALSDANDARGDIDDASDAVNDAKDALDDAREARDALDDLETIRLLLNQESREIIRPERLKHPRMPISKRKWVG